MIFNKKYIVWKPFKWALLSFVTFIQIFENILSLFVFMSLFWRGRESIVRLFWEVNYTIVSNNSQRKGDTLTTLSLKPSMTAFALSPRKPETFFDASFNVCCNSACSSPTSSSIKHQVDEKKSYYIRYHFFLWGDLPRKTLPKIVLQDLKVKLKKPLATT